MHRVSRLLTGPRPFRDGPRCRHQTVAARGFRLSPVGSSSGGGVLEWFLGLFGWDAWWQRLFDDSNRSETTPLAWLDQRLRRAKLARAQIARHGGGLVCPNCLHLEPQGAR